MRVVRWALSALVLLLVAGSALVTVLHLVDVRTLALIFLAGLGPLAVAGFVVGFVLALILAIRARRSRSVLLVSAAVCLAGLVLQTVWLLPAFTGSAYRGPAGTQPEGPRLRVGTANLHLGTADPAGVLALARRVDVLAVEEVTPAERDRLLHAGITSVLPHEAGTPGWRAPQQGVMVFSRYPLSPLPELTAQQAVVARVAGPVPFTLVAVHATMPGHGVHRWLSDLDAVHALCQRVRGPLVVAGDLNATRDDLRFRRLLEGGLRDAAEAANSGLQPTWPTSLIDVNGWTWGWPVLTIDHVLVDPDVLAKSTSTVGLAGSDHRGLVADLVLRVAH